MSTDLTVIVVTYQSAEDLPGFVESLNRSAGLLAVRVVVVDNASTDGSADVARELGVECVRSDRNLGYGGGVNRGRALAASDAPILVANPDIRFRGQAVVRLVDEARRRGAVCVPRIIDQAGSTRPSLRREPTLRRQLGEALLGDRLGGRPDSWSLIVRDPAAYATAQSVEWATGAVMVIPPDCDATVGAWSEVYFLYSEEVDYCRRVREAGFRIQYVPDAVAYHAEGGSGRAASLVALDAVNRLRYFRSRNPVGRSYAFAGLVVLEKVIRSSDRAERGAARAVVRHSGRPLMSSSMPDGREVLRGLTHAQGGVQ